MEITGNILESFEYSGKIFHEDLLSDCKLNINEKFIRFINVETNLDLIILYNKIVFFAMNDNVPNEKDEKENNIFTNGFIFVQYKISDYLEDSDKLLKFYPEENVKSKTIINLLVNEIYNKIDLNNLANPDDEFKGIIFVLIFR